MKGWRFALNRRWASYLAIAIVFAIACTALALWQIARREETRAEITRVETNWDSVPRPIGEVLPTLSAFSESDKWLPVVLTGSYLSSEQLLVRGRPLNSSPGFEVLVPFQLDGGAVFVVDRGWLPAGNRQDAPETVPLPPTGKVTVIVRLKAGEPTVPGRSAPAGQIATIHLPDIAQRVAVPTYTGSYGVLASESPAVTPRPTAVAKPVADEGPHLSYAFQWVAFGILGFVALGWALRQEYRIRNSDDPQERKRAAERRRKAAAKPRTDGEVEDEILARWSDQNPASVSRGVARGGALVPSASEPATEDATPG